ncbi:glycoside hydrolase family 43 protein [soil metagenome]
MRRSLSAVAVALWLAFAACTGDGGTATDVSPTGTAREDASASGTASQTASQAASEPPDAEEGQYTNPVLTQNFADPHVIEVDGTYYAYATGNLNVNLQVAVSQDLAEWERLGEALPRLPFWQPSSRGLTWAPEVAETSAGFVMYYTGRDVQEGKQCISVAVAQDPAGTFLDESEEPFICQYDLGGSIDPHYFQDEDGTPYLLWKNDGNCCGMRTRLYIQELSDDGLELVGEPIDMGVQNDRPWEADLIEAPTLYLHDGTYYLFYSANAYNTDRYAAGYATADEVTGPYADATENPILVSADPAAGPGGQSIIEGPDGDLWVVYHAWDSSLVGDHLGGQRSMWLDELHFEDGRAVIEGPDEGPQPVP